MTLKISLLFLLLDLLFGSPSCGKAVHYSPTWGTWTCPREQKCGIAARNGVTVPKGVWPVATPLCRDLGRRGYLSISNAHPEEIVVADCADPADLEVIRSRGIVVEVPYLVAERHGFVGDGWARASLWLLPAPASRHRGGCTAKIGAKVLR